MTEPKPPAPVTEVEAKFLCWCDDGGGPDNATGYESYDASGAASDCAAYEYEQSAGEASNPQVIHVRDKSGAWRVFDVTTDYSPSFIPRERP